jgi:hypothetical protein
VVALAGEAFRRGATDAGTGADHETNGFRHVVLLHVVLLVVWLKGNGVRSLHQVWSPRVGIVLSSRLRPHRSQKRLVSFPEGWVTKYISRRHQLAIAAPLVAAMAARLRVLGNLLPWQRNTKLPREPAQGCTLVRRFVIHGKIHTVWLSQLHEML